MRFPDLEGGHGSALHLLRSFPDTHLSEVPMPLRPTVKAPFLLTHKTPAGATAQRTLTPAGDELSAGWLTLSAIASMQAERFPAQLLGRGQEIVLSAVPGVTGTIHARIVRDDAGAPSRTIARMADGRTLLAIDGAYILLAQDSEAATLLRGLDDSVAAAVRAAATTARSKRAVADPAHPAGYQKLSGAFAGSEGWLGWLEDEERTWLALVDKDGAILLWDQRAPVTGLPTGEPTTLARNVNKEPLTRAKRRTTAQQPAGPYGEVVHQGLRIVIERQRGSSRVITTADGTELTVNQGVDYGFYPYLGGDDGDAYDAFADNNPVAPRVRVATKVRLDGRYEQQKSFVGTDTDEQAKAVFLAHYPAKSFGRIGSLSIDDFKAQAAEAQSLGRVLRVETDEDSAELSVISKFATNAGLGPFKSLAGTIPGTDPTDFPNKGDNRSISFRGSAYPRFDVSFTARLAKTSPALYEDGTDPSEGTPHFALLARVAKQGGTAKSKAEVVAMRAREAWGEKNASDTTLSGILAQARWCIVGAAGMDGMKAAINEAKAAAKKTAGKGAEEDAPEDDGEEAAALSAADKTPPSSEEPSIPAPSSEPSSGPALSSTERERKRLAAAERLTPQAPVNPTHRSEDAADPGPMSTRAPTAAPGVPMPRNLQKEAHDRSYASIVAGLAALALASNDPELVAERSVFHALLARDAGLAGRAPAALDVPGAAEPAVSGSDDHKPVAGAKRRTTVELSKGPDGQPAIDEVARTAWFIASTDCVDSYGEIVEQTWVFDRWKTNPVILWGHKSGDPPIGHAKEWKVVNNQLLIKVFFSAVNPFAEMIWLLILEGTVRACSVGFMPGEVTYRDVKGVRRAVLSMNSLYELSICSIPANQEAICLAEDRLAKVLGDIEKHLAKLSLAPDPTPEQRSLTGDLRTAQAQLQALAAAAGITAGVVEHKLFKLAQSSSFNTKAARERVMRGCSSDGSGKPETIDLAKYRACFLWIDGDPADLASYKGIHTDFLDGVFKTSCAAVVAAAGAIAQVPEDVRAGVQAHLDQHFTELKLTPPWKRGEKTANTAAPRGASPHEKTMPIHIRKLDQAAIKSLRDEGFHTLTCEGCGDETRIEEGSVQKAILESEGRAKTAEAALEPLKKTVGDLEVSLKSVSDERAALLGQLTALELTPLVGLELHQLSQAAADSLGLIRASHPAVYKAQLQEAQAKHQRGVAELKAKADQAEALAKKTGEEADRLAAEAAKKTAENAADPNAVVVKTPPTHAPDPNAGGSAALSGPSFFDKAAQA